MKSTTTDSFWPCYRELPENIRRLARKNFRLWLADPATPGLAFKALKGYDNLYSVRIGLKWRALGRRRDDTIHWFWIGPHAEYDRLLSERGVSE